MVVTICKLFGSNLKMKLRDIDTDIRKYFKNKTNDTYNEGFVYYWVNIPIKVFNENTQVMRNLEFEDGDFDNVRDLDSLKKICSEFSGVRDYHFSFENNYITLGKNGTTNDKIILLVDYDKLSFYDDEENEFVLNNRAKVSKIMNQLIEYIKEY